MKNQLIELEKKVSEYFIFLESKGYYEVDFILDNLYTDLKSENMYLSDYPSLEVRWLNNDLQKEIKLIIYIEDGSIVPIFKFQNLKTKHQFADYDYFAEKYKIKGVFRKIEGKDDLEKLMKYFDVIKLEFDKDLGKLLFTESWENIEKDWSPYK
jgi:hypothetical protein